ncbi:hypothetical protein BYT27DRAFT_6396238 [Phlegmacium glaucopus]|nr:hypothetical protein BYT27DRAFT_6396238 [Phlegmacium glaucopus]
MQDPADAACCLLLSLSLSTRLPMNVCLYWTSCPPAIYNRQSPTHKLMVIPSTSGQVGFKRLMGGLVDNQIDGDLARPWVGLPVVTGQISMNICADFFRVRYVKGWVLTKCMDQGGTEKGGGNK